jgi:hypothetical protein
VPGAEQREVGHCRCALLCSEDGIKAFNHIKRDTDSAKKASNELMILPAHLWPNSNPQARQAILEWGGMNQQRLLCVARTPATTTGGSCSQHWNGSVGTATVIVAGDSGGSAAEDFAAPN